MPSLQVCSSYLDTVLNIVAELHETLYVRRACVHIKSTLSACRYVTLLSTLDCLITDVRVGSAGLVVIPRSCILVASFSVIIFCEEKGSCWRLLSFLLFVSPVFSLFFSTYLRFLHLFFSSLLFSSLLSSLLFSVHLFSFYSVQDVAGL